MTKIEDILNYVKSAETEPIYEIFCIENPDKELIYKDGQYSGLPDIGNSYSPGFFYDIYTARHFVKHNLGDIHETCYDACFILCKFPGIYQSVCKDSRMYFVFNHETKEYEQKEEPDIFSHIAY